MFCLRVCCCVFSCCALVSLLLLCSRVPSPAVLCVHRPLLSLLNSHAPSSSTDPTHYSTPSRSLSGARHILIPPVPSTSLCVVSLDRSVAFPVQSLQRTEFIRHIFLIRFLSFLSSVLRHWRSRLGFGEVTNRRSPSRNGRKCGPTAPALADAGQPGGDRRPAGRRRGRDGRGLCAERGRGGR